MGPSTFMPTNPRGTGVPGGRERAAANPGAIRVTTTVTTIAPSRFIAARV